MENPIKDMKFSVIRVHNSANKAETLDGYTVYRNNQLFFDGKLVFCAPYDNHFIYEDTSGKIHRWLQMCTCGSFAYCVGYKGYKRDGSPTTKAESTDAGQMFVCHAHATTGKHADWST